MRSDSPVAGQSQSTGSTADPTPLAGSGARPGAVPSAVAARPTTGEASTGETATSETASREVFAHEASVQEASAGEASTPPDEPVDLVSADGAVATVARDEYRQGSADPVRGLLHRYRTLCERAVDPLEIAAGLEVRGVTDDTAARFRHGDLFSLAEELYTRVPHPVAPVPTAGTEYVAPTGSRLHTVVRVLGQLLLQLLPGALGAAMFAALAATPPGHQAERVAIGVCGALAIVLAARLALRRIPVSRTAAVALCWLLGYALYGEWLLTGLLPGAGLRTPPAMADSWVVLSLAGAVAPAAWCAHCFARRARRRLATSHSLGEYATGVRPLLATTLGAFTAALVVVESLAGLATGAVRPQAPFDGLAVPQLQVPELAVPHLPTSYTAWADLGVAQPATSDLLDAGRSALTGAPLAVTALGVLLFLALLLAWYGFSGAATAGLSGAAAVQAVAVGSVLVTELPPFASLAEPVAAVVGAVGPWGVPAAACAGAALALLGYASRTLTCAAVHHRAPTW